MWVMQVASWRGREPSKQWEQPSTNLVSVYSWHFVPIVVIIYHITFILTICILVSWIRLWIPWRQKLYLFPCSILSSSLVDDAWYMISKYLMRKQVKDRSYEGMHGLNDFSEVTQLVRDNAKSRPPELWFLWKIKVAHSMEAFFFLNRFPLKDQFAVSRHIE